MNAGMNFSVKDEAVDPFQSPHVSVREKLNKLRAGDKIHSDLVHICADFEDGCISHIEVHAAGGFRNRPLLIIPRSCFLSMTGQEIAEDLDVAKSQLISLGILNESDHLKISQKDKVASFTINSSGEVLDQVILAANQTAGSVLGMAFSLLTTARVMFDERNLKLEIVCEK